MKNKKLDNKFITFISAIVIVSLILLGNVLYIGVTGKSWEESPLYQAGQSISHAYLSASGRTVTTDDGEKIYSFDDSKIFRTGEGLGYAPAPLKTFRDKTCDLKPLREVTELTPNSWSSPDVNRRFPNITSHASFVEAGQNNEPIVPPDAPDGIIYSLGAHVGDTQGAILLAGHVDYAPGALSAEGGELSPWGETIHRFDSCDHVYVSGDNGGIEEYVVVSLYPEEQNQVASNPEYFRNTGDKTLYLVTCSGPAVGDAGGSFQMNYQDNIIAKAIPVQE